MIKFLKYDNNNYAIKLKKSKQLLYNLIYSLELMKLEILKAYIKLNLANDFIQLFKSYISISILFDQKKNNRFYLYINY